MGNRHKVIRDTGRRFPIDSILIEFRDRCGYEKTTNRSIEDSHNTNVVGEKCKHVIVRFSIHKRNYCRSVDTSRECTNFIKSILNTIIHVNSLIVSGIVEEILQPAL